MTVKKTQTADVELKSDKDIVAYLDALLEAELNKDNKSLVEKIKYKLIGTSLNVIVEGKTITKKVDKQQVEEFKTLVEKYNKFEGKNISITTDKLKAKVLSFIQAETIKKEEETKEKVNNLKIEKKILKKTIKKEEEIKTSSVEQKPKLTLSEMNELERESRRTLTRADKGYVHPVTGRTWDGEYYR